MDVNNKDAATATTPKTHKVGSAARRSVCLIFVFFVQISFSQSYTPKSDQALIYKLNEHLDSDIAAKKLLSYVDHFYQFYLHLKKCLQISRR
jgi:hypothetical protein